jgi:hypothetical protein
MMRILSENPNRKEVIQESLNQDLGPYTVRKEVMIKREKASIPDIVSQTSFRGWFSTSGINFDTKNMRRSGL